MNEKNCTGKQKSIHFGLLAIYAILWTGWLCNGFCPVGILTIRQLLPGDSFLWDFSEGWGEEGAMKPHVK